VTHLTILTECRDSQSVMRLRGELDVSSKIHLRRAISAVLDHHDPQLLVLDLAALSFSDCAGLSVVMWAHKRLAAQGRKLVVTDAQPAVRRLLQLTSADTVLHLCSPEPEPEPRFQPGPRYHMPTPDSATLSASPCPPSHLQPCSGARESETPTRVRLA
jgi:anti-anti-sigma factor